MTWTTPEQFASLLDAEAVGREPCTDVGAPFRGVPRKLSEQELLTPQELMALEARRRGRTLRDIGDNVLGKSQERVRMILAGARRRWAMHNKAGFVGTCEDCGRAYVTDHWLEFMHRCDECQEAR